MCNRLRIGHLNLSGIAQTHNVAEYGHHEQPDSSLKDLNHTFKSVVYVAFFNIYTLYKFVTLLTFT